MLKRLSLQIAHQLGIIERQEGVFMEEKRGLLTYFGGIVRIVLAVIIVIAISFIIIRITRGNNSGDSSQTVQQTEQNQQAAEGSGGSNSNRDEAKNSSGDSNNGAQGSESSEDEVPLGFADGERAPSTGPSSVPEVGLASDLFITAALLSAAAFLFVKNRQYSHAQS